MAFCGFDGSCDEDSRALLALINGGLNATEFAFAPEVISVVDSVTKRTAAISDTTVRMGLLSTSGASSGTRTQGLSGRDVRQHFLSASAQAVGS